MKDTEKITIVCGKCGENIANANPKIKTIQTFNCRKCWKRTVYNPETLEVKVVDIPSRNTSSGMTFV